MGCNCGKSDRGQDTSKSRPQIIQVKSTPVEVKTEILTQPNYSQEDLDKVNEYLISSNKTNEQRIFAMELMRQEFGDVLTGYCDQSCLRHLKSRLDNLQKRLNQYENK